MIISPGESAHVFRKNPLLFRYSPATYFFCDVTPFPVKIRQNVSLSTSLLRRNSFLSPDPSYDNRIGDIATQNSFSYPLGIPHGAVRRFRVNSRWLSVSVR